MDALHRILLCSLALGTPVLTLFGAIGSALTLCVRGGGVLVALLVLPLYMPVLIFGAGAVSAQLSGLDSSAYLLLLGALFAGAAVPAPWAASLALRIAVEQGLARMFIFKCEFIRLLSATKTIC